VTWERVKPWLGTVARLLLGVVWIWAAVSKLGSPRTFVQTVRAYDVTWEWLSKAIGYGLPVLELCIGIVLVLGIVVRLAAIVSAGLCLVFLIGLIQASARGIKLQCGCFGGGGTTGGSTQYTLDILRDLGLIVVAAYLIVWSFTRVSLEEFLARGDYVVEPSAKRLRTAEGRRKYEAMVAARQRNARNRALWLNISLGVVIALIALIGVGVQANRAKISGSLTAAHASVNNGVVYGTKAAATVDIYEDFQCPHCLEFENAVQKTLDADVTANRAQVRFHVMSFLDSSSNGNRYSSRAANAALCASDDSVASFVKYHNLLYGKYKGKQVQPAEGSDGRTDGDLNQYAQSIGFTKTRLSTFESCVSGETHKGLVQAITDKASKDGINSTPTVKVNGKSVEPTLAALTKAIAEADAKGPKPTPSPSPSPSPSKPASSTASTSAPASSTSSGRAKSTSSSKSGASSSSAPRSGNSSTNG
jgi:protein-disulfide isomerase